MLTFLKHSTINQDPSLFLREYKHVKVFYRKNLLFFIFLTQLRNLRDEPISVMAGSKASVYTCRAWLPSSFWLCSSCLDLYPHKLSVSSGRSEDILRPQADICLSPFEPKPEPLFGIWIEKKTKQEKAPSALVVREDNSGSGKTGIFFCSFMGLEHLICIQWACSSCLQKWLL